MSKLLELAAKFEKKAAGEGESYYQAGPGRAGGEYEVGGAGVRTDALMRGVRQGLQRLYEGRPDAPKVVGVRTRSRGYDRAAGKDIIEVIIFLNSPVTGPLTEWLNKNRLAFQRVMGLTDQQMVRFNVTSSVQDWGTAAERSKQLKEYLAKQYGPGAEQTEQAGVARPAPPTTPGPSQITPPGFQTGSSPWRPTGNTREFNGKPHIEVENTETGQKGWQPMAESSSIQHDMMKLAARFNKGSASSMQALAARLVKNAAVADCGHETASPISPPELKGKTVCENCYSKMALEGKIQPKPGAGRD